jgi:gamma-glutamylcyclotransferase (GGCT)/AIG2-like uncharacterized protein YtfP
MLDRLFVYGTLMRGFDHPMSRLLSREADFEGSARCQGQLFLIRHYPGLVASDDPDDVVSGEVFVLRQPHQLLKTLDDYEQCGATFPQPNEYRREVCSITFVDGSTVEAWTYLYNWPVARMPRIASGRFLEL